jgi:hypothetical protein
MSPAPDGLSTSHAIPSDVSHILAVPHLNKTLQQAQQQQKSANRPAGFTHVTNSGTSALLPLAEVCAEHQQLQLCNLSSMFAVSLRRMWAYKLSGIHHVAGLQRHTQSLYCPVHAFA